MSNVQQDPNSSGCTYMVQCRQLGLSDPHCAASPEQRQLRTLQIIQVGLDSAGRSG